MATGRPKHTHPSSHASSSTVRFQVFLKRVSGFISSEETASGFLRFAELPLRPPLPVCPFSGLPFVHLEDVGRKRGTEKKD
jgi:hypothetical protein